MKKPRHFFTKALLANIVLLAIVGQVMGPGTEYIIPVFLLDLLLGVAIIWVDTIWKPS